MVTGSWKGRSEAWYRPRAWTPMLPARTPTTTSLLLAVKLPRDESPSSRPACCTGWSRCRGQRRQAIPAILLALCGMHPVRDAGRFSVRILRPTNLVDGSTLKKSNRHLLEHGFVENDQPGDRCGSSLLDCTQPAVRRARSWLWKAAGTWLEAERIGAVCLN